VWIFNPIEHDQQGMLSSFGCDDIIEFDVLLGGCNRNDALMPVVPGHAIEFRTRHGFHGHTLSPAFVDDMLQPDIVALFRYSYP
jgi:hypothetical protein